MTTTTNPRPIDITAHVLPLLELCRYASMASSAVTGLQAMAGVMPEFRKQVNNAAPYLSELADSQAGDLVAGVLWVAIDLLSQYENQPSTGEA
jgi:hypothetical protein